MTRPININYVRKYTVGVFEHFLVISMKFKEFFTIQLTWLKIRTASHLITYIRLNLTHFPLIWVSLRGVIIFQSLLCPWGKVFQSKTLAAYVEDRMMILFVPMISRILNLPHMLFKLWNSRASDQALLKVEQVQPYFWLLLITFHSIHIHFNCIRNRSVKR